MSDTRSWPKRAACLGRYAVAVMFVCCLVPACGNDEQGKVPDTVPDVEALTDAGAVMDSTVKGDAAPETADVQAHDASDGLTRPVDTAPKDTLVADAHTPDTGGAIEDAESGDAADCDVCPPGDTCDGCVSTNACDTGPCDTTSAPPPGAGCPGGKFVDRLWRVSLTKDIPSPLRNWPANMLVFDPESSLVAVADHSVILHVDGKTSNFDLPSGAKWGIGGRFLVRLSGEGTPVGTLVTSAVGEVDDYLKCDAFLTGVLGFTDFCDADGPCCGPYSELLSLGSTVLWNDQTPTLIQYPIPLSGPSGPPWVPPKPPGTPNVGAFAAIAPGQLFFWGNRGWWARWSYPGKKLLQYVPQTAYLGALKAKVSFLEPTSEPEAQAGHYDPANDTVAFAVILSTPSTWTDAPAKAVVFRLDNKPPHALLSWTDLDPKITGDLESLQLSLWGVQLLPGPSGELVLVTKLGSKDTVDKELSAPADHPSVACRIDAKGKVRWCRKVRDQLQLLGARAVVDTNGDLVVIGVSKPGYSPSATGAPKPTAPLHVVRLDHEGGHEIDRVVLDQQVPVTALPHIVRRSKPGFFASAGGNVYSLDAWFRHSCQASGTCSLLPWSTCDDKDPCTRDRCEPTSAGGHTCSHVPLPSGATCAVVGGAAVGFCGAKGCTKGP